MSLFLYFRYVDVDVSQRSLSGTPSSILDSILAVAVQGLDQVDMFSTAILPMDFADFSIVMKKIKSTFATAAAAASCVDLADSTSRDGNFVDFLFGKRLTTDVRVPEFTAAEQHVSMNYVSNLHLEGPDILFNDSVLDRDLTVLEVVPDVERHPLRIVLVHDVS